MDDATPTTSTPTPTPPPADPVPEVPPATSTFGGPTTPVAPAPPASPPPPATPSWEPKHDRHDGGGRTAGVVGGLILLGLGLWFFAERTLDLDMPDIRWSQLWPLILILIGLAILVGALRRDRR